MTGRAFCSPHIKTFARFDSSSPTRLAWCLIGSHNLSMVAFGKLEMQGRQLYIKSYEMGVLITPASTGCELVTTAHAGGAL